MKAYVVLNPVAGDNARELVLDALKTYFDDAGIDYEVYETAEEDKPGDIVRDRLENGKFDFVVAAGGDGTVSQVINGLIDSGLPLGIIPVGTGNMLARSLDLPLKIDKAVALISGPHVLKKIDAMRINNRICVLNASLGISAKVMRDTKSESKNRFGLLAYIWEALGKLFKIKRSYITINIDGKTTKHHAIEATVFNSGIIAETLYPKGPDIRIDDGHLDVLIISFKTIRDYPLYILRMITKKTSKNLTDFIEANKSVMIESTVSMPLQVDGEIFGTTPVEIEVLPSAITVIVSEKSIKKEK
ncbi:MAG: diacylglycerol kinase family lipid kinase [Dethiosulfatibacter sp.]|nr:diacylglycerol kinase family lipid kinase [Dethiosulfatibacter sp.]